MVVVAVVLSTCHVHKQVSMRTRLLSIQSNGLTACGMRASSRAVSASAKRCESRPPWRRDRALRQQCALADTGWRLGDTPSAPVNGISEDHDGLYKQREGCETSGNSGRRQLKG